MLTYHNCQIVAVKIVKDRNGDQRFRCNACRKTFQASSEKRIGNVHLPLEKTVLCLQLPVEGNGIRSTERTTGVNRNTILELLVKAGEKCVRLLNDKIEGEDTGVYGKDLQSDWRAIPAATSYSSALTSPGWILCMQNPSRTHFKTTENSVVTRHLSPHRRRPMRRQRCGWRRLPHLCRRRRRQFPA